MLLLVSGSNVMSVEENEGNSKEGECLVFKPALDFLLIIIHVSSRRLAAVFWGGR